MVFVLAMSARLLLSAVNKLGKLDEELTLQKQEVLPVPIL